MPILTEIRRKLPLRPRPEPDEIADLSSDRVHHIRVQDIIPNRAQPRSAFNQNAIARLADSIRRYGILQPLTVRKIFIPRPHGSDGPPTLAYELVAGERRLRAAKLAQLDEVPCIVINTDDATSAELAIVENLLRENLNMFEQAEAFDRLIREFHLTQEEAARRVSMSQSAVANKLRILRLLPEEREKIVEAGLSERHARALLKLNDPQTRGQALQHILDQKLNVSASETYIERLCTEIARAEAQKQQLLAQKAAQEAQNAKEEETFAFPSEIQNVMERRRARFKGSIKDMQVFYNSVQNAINFLYTAGIEGRIDKQESENQVVVTITLSKSERFR
jgi:ParB family chromosome partitioning protein